MQYAPGNVVRSSAGRDRGHLYCVLSVTPERVLVADGKRRRVNNPKPKNPAHLELLRQGGPVLISDDEIRQVLQRLLDESPMSEEKGGN